MTTMQIISRVANENLRPAIPPGCRWAHVMEACWHESPARRWLFDRILEELQGLLEEAEVEEGGEEDRLLDGR